MMFDRRRFREFGPDGIAAALSTPIVAACCACLRARARKAPAHARFVVDVPKEHRKANSALAPTRRSRERVALVRSFPSTASGPCPRRRPSALSSRRFAALDCRSGVPRSRCER
jgi:hypothetical protein